MHSQVHTCTCFWASNTQESQTSSRLRAAAALGGIQDPAEWDLCLPNPSNKICKPSYPALVNIQRPDSFLAFILFYKFTVLGFRRPAPFRPECSGGKSVFFFFCLVSRHIFSIQYYLVVSSLAFPSENLMEMSSWIWDLTRDSRKLMIFPALGYRRSFFSPCPFQSWVFTVSGGARFEGLLFWECPSDFSLLGKLSWTASFLLDFVVTCAWCVGTAEGGQKLPSPFSAWSALGCTLFGRECVYPSDFRTSFSGLSQKVEKWS